MVEERSHQPMRYMYRCYRYRCGGRLEISQLGRGLACRLAQDPCDLLCTTIRQAYDHPTPCWIVARFERLLSALNYNHSRRSRVLKDSKRDNLNTSSNTRVRKERCAKSHGAWITRSLFWNTQNTSTLGSLHTSPRIKTPLFVITVLI